MAVTKKKIFIGLTVGIGATAIVAAIAHPGMPRADANGDGILTNVELSAMIDKGFKRIDANSDGVVDMTERKQMRDNKRGQRFGKRMFARMDSNEDGRLAREEASSAISKMFDRMDRDGDGQIKADEQNGRFGGSLGLGKMMIGQLDSNDDGIVAREEARSAALGMYDRVDTNSDGQLSTSEREQMRERFGARMTERLGQVDTNEDDRLSRKEVGVYAQENFRRADTDGDGQLTAEERQAAFTTLRAKESNIQG